MKKISSLHNPFVKRLLLLQEKARERKGEGVFVVEGRKEISMAINNGFSIEAIGCREGSKFEEAIAEHHECVELSEAVFDKIAYRGSGSGAIAIARQKQHGLSSLSLSAHPLLLVLDGIEKPGNLGAMLRSADAAGIDGVICCDLRADLYNPNVIRSSVGCFFSVPLAVCSREEALHFLQEKKINIFTASLKASKAYTLVDYRRGCAFVLGTEASGVDTVWEQCSTENIIIPMHGQNDSLNVSNTAAILLFEALRQRRH